MDRDPLASIRALLQATRVLSPTYVGDSDWSRCRPHVTWLVGVVCAALLLAQPASAAWFTRDDPDPAQLIGTWRGTSTCTDRVAAPACQDETVVYEFTAGPRPGTVHWAADKVVNGKREPMGEFDLVYVKAESCWKAEFTSPRVKVV